MLHDKGDRNGASSSIFWLPLDRSKSVQELHNSAIVQRLDSKYCLFAYVIEGNDILQQLRPGDLLVSAKVEEGVWQLAPATTIKPPIVDPSDD